MGIENQSNKTAQILVVDDSKIVRNQMFQILQDLGYQVLLAEDGEDCLQKVHQHDDIKMIFLDVNMPKLDGLEVIDELAKEGRTKDIAVIMVTTESSIDMANRVKEAGAKGWVTKPISSSIAKSLTDKFAKSS